MSDWTVRGYVGAPPERVFNALTEPGELTEWFAEHVDVDLDAGRYAFRGRYTPSGEPGQLLDAEPGRRLRFSWAGAAVEITLDPDGTGTFLTLHHPDATPPLTSFWYFTVANLANHVEGRSLMPRFDYSERATDTAVNGAVIDAPPAAVFAALTDPEQLTRWMLAKDPRVAAEVGGRYDIGWDHGPIRILELVPDRVLAYSWAYPDSPDTVVRWELEGSGGRTHLTVVHSGFADPELAEDYRGGWPGFLIQLKRLLELGPDHRPIEGGW